MGLNIQVYNDLKLVKRGSYDFVANVIDPAWDYKIKNLEKGGKYKGNLIDETIATPYSSHGVFRAFLLMITGNKHLIKPNNKPDYEAIDNSDSSDIPFIELIDFADNEGCLDWEIA